MKKAVCTGAVLAALGLAAPVYAATKTITANSTVSGRLERGDATRKGDWTDSYVYTGEAGEELWVHRTLSTFSLWVEGPNGFRQESNGDPVKVRLPRNGRYEIMVHLPKVYVPTDYQLSVWRLNTAPGPSTFKSGETVEGSFSSADRQDPTSSRLLQDSYSYTAQAGETTLFHFEGQQSDLNVEITGPNNFKRYESASPGYAGNLGAYFREAGEYRVLVSGNGGNYSLQAQPKQAAAVAQPIGHVALGETVQLAYSADAPLSDAHASVSVHTFDAQAGERLTLIRSAATGALVRAPDGTAVPGKTTHVTNQSEYLTQVEFTAPVTGRYRIEAPISPSMPAAEGVLRLVTSEQGDSMVAAANDREQRRQVDKAARVANALQRGNDLLNSNSNNAALEAFREALELQYDNVPAMIGKGVAYYRLGDYTVSVWAFEDALRTEPGNQLAATNLAAARSAEQGQQQQQQLAYEQRRQEDANAWSNALGAFSAGVGIGMAMNEAAAVAAAPPPEPSWPAPSAPSQYASGGSLPTPSEPSSGGPRVGKVSFLNPDTGKQCVMPGRTYTEARDDGGFNYYWVFTNTCNTTFRVFTYMNTVEPGYPPEQSAGIQPGSTARPTELKMICIFTKYNMRQSCKGYNRYEVRYP